MTHKGKMKNGLLLICFAAIFFGLIIPANYGEGRKLAVAVVDFNNLSGRDLGNIGEASNEILGTLLFQTDRFDIIERAKLNTILKEQKLSLSGLIDSEKSALKVGKLLSADYIVTGSIVSYEAEKQRIEAYGTVTEKIQYQMNVNVKILNVNTGKVEFTEMAPAQEQVLNMDNSVSKESTGNTRKLLTKALSAVVDKLVEKLEASQPDQGEKVMVSFNSKPTGADVEIDQVYYGNTPLEIPVNPGKHIVKISLSGYAPWTKTIDAFEGLKVTCALEKKKDIKVNIVH